MALSSECIAPQEAAAVARLCHRQSGRTAYGLQAKPAATGLLPATNQPWSAV